MRTAQGRTFCFKMTTKTQSKKATAASKATTTPEEITLLEKIRSDEKKTVVHLGIAASAVPRMRKVAEKRGKTLEEYLSGAMFERFSHDFVEDREDAGNLPPAADLKWINRRRTRALSAKLSTPAEELVEMFLSAALDAVEASLESAGKIELPLAFTTARQGKLPIYFDAANVRFLREVCEAAEITGGGDGVAEMLIADLIEDTHRTNPGGLSTGIPELVLDTFEIPDKATAEKAMHAVIARWRKAK